MDFTEKELNVLRILLKNKITETSKMWTKNEHTQQKHIIAMAVGGYTAVLEKVEALLNRPVGEK